MKDAPDTSWINMEEISDGPPVLTWAMFLLTLMMGATTIALLFH